jgi:uncharacterized protein YbbC (DUF1343 family)
LQQALRYYSGMRSLQCTLVAIVTCCVAATAPTSFPGARAIDDLIETAIHDGKIPGAVVLVGHNGQVVYQKAYGKRSLVPGAEPMTLDTIFDCASLTKVVATTSSVMALFEAGKIRISDKVTDYLPEFQHGHSDITIRDLMTHYSGLKPDLELVPVWSGYETGIRMALADPPSIPREAKFVYSDINFELMGEIVRRVSGQPLNEFARDHVFQPLGMTETMFRPPAALIPRIAPTEELEPGQVLRGTVHDPTARYMGGVAGHAGMFSTALDLSRFCQMMLDRSGKLFSAVTIDYFTSPQSPVGMNDVRGLGWDIDSKYSGNRGELFPAGKSYGHTGFTGTSIWIDPGSDTYVILLTNAVHPKVGKPITPLRKSVATVVAAAVGYGAGKPESVRTGLDVAEANHFAMLTGKRVGLITNQTGIDSQGRRNIDVMRQAGVHLTAIFSPEHGFLGVEDRANVAGMVDPASGIRVFSLYTEKTMRPTPVMLRDLDVVVFDIADVGARFYTFATTMAFAMEECARAGKPFIVLDRPNPITGLHVEGPVLDVRNESFVGYFPLPLRHGMTIGELAQMFNGENKLGADLTVVPLAGWHRADWFDATGLRWVNPSPNIRNLTAALLYPGVGMLEYSEGYSVGRGTDSPFELIRAKWMDGNQLAAYLNARNIPGVRVYPMLESVRFVVTDRAIFDAERLGLEVAGALLKLYPGKIKLDANRTLIGSDHVMTRLRNGDDSRQVWLDDEAGLAPFLEMRQRYLLYE